MLPSYRPHDLSNAWLHTPHEGGVGGDAACDVDGEQTGESPPAVYVDATYASGDNLARLEQLGAKPMVKTQPAVACAGRFTKDDFTVDLATATVTCPAQPPR
jgi:hypothetical protein